MSSRLTADMLNLLGAGLIQGWDHRLSQGSPGQYTTAHRIHANNGTPMDTSFIMCFIMNNKWPSRKHVSA